jgi:branched-subunit amino acid ABC-type transport system permease component
MVAGCGLSIDADQARICRSTLPALYPGTAISLVRVMRGTEPHSIRVAFLSIRPGRQSAGHIITCVFANEGLSSGKSELTGIVTDRGPVSGANLYFLKNYYLDTPEGIAGDPGSDPSAVLPVVPAQVAYAAQQILSALPRMAIYAMLASAFALVFGLTKRINLAFGELAAAGAAATVAGTALVIAGFNLTTPVAGLAVGLVAAVFTGALYSAVGGAIVIGHIRAWSSQPSLIATVGLSLFLMEYLRLVQSPVTVWLPPVWSQTLPIARSGSFVLSATPVSLMTGAIALAAGMALIVVMRRSAFGRAWRASADDPLAAALFGVNERGLLRTTLAISGAMAGLSGTLIVAQYGALGFAGGFQFGLKALVAAVIGGIGSVPGALLGGLAVGLFETLWSAYCPIEGRDIALYSALAIFLIYRPGGLLGWRELTPRPV